MVIMKQRNPERKKLLGTPKHRWQEKVMADLGETESGVMD
jgi:hypothetical protein